MVAREERERQKNSMKDRYNVGYGDDDVNDDDVVVEDWQWQNQCQTIWRLCLIRVVINELLLFGVPDVESVMNHVVCSVLVVCSKCGWEGV